MELPEHIQKLYRHFSFHTAKKNKAGLCILKDRTLERHLTWFIQERIAIWKKKTSGTTPPFTKDEVLAQYRFCNIFREFDRQTIEFHERLNPLRDDFPLWLLNMFYFRMVARTETVQTVGLLSFDMEENKKLYERLMKSSRPRYGTPYVFPVSVIQKSKTPTRELFITEHLPKVMKAVAQEIQSWERVSVYEGVERLLPLFKYNLRFLWTEVLIDTAYQFPQHLDLFGRFPIGPGSLPTMKRIDAQKDPAILVCELAQVPIATGLTYKKKPLRLSAENWEGIGREYRKYTNLRAGKGRRRIFHSGR